MKKLLILLIAALASIQMEAVVRVGNLFYELNKKNHTASVFSPYDEEEQLDELHLVYLDTLEIPATIKHQGKTYRVTGVYGGALSHLEVKVVILPKSIKEIDDDAFLFVPTVHYPKIAYKFAHGIAYYPVETGYMLRDGDEDYLPEQAMWWNGTTINCYVDSPFIYLDACKQDLVGCMPSAQGTIVIPDSVVNIGQGTFWDCREVSSVVVPDKVEHISDGAFWKVQDVIYSGTLEGAPWGATSLNGQSVSY